MNRTVEMKLYPTAFQAATLGNWLRRCCWVYNQALEHRIKAYKRRKESVTFYGQCVVLTGWRERIKLLRDVPRRFLVDAIRRLDKGFRAFFRRLESGKKPGFPRFRSKQRYRSMEFLEVGNYIRPGAIYIPRIGAVRARGQFDVQGSQPLLRIIQRATGWYAQVLVKDGGTSPPKVIPATTVGVDVGLESFATLSTGEKIENPRFLCAAERKLKRLQRRLTRCRKGSRNRKKAVLRVARHHERIASQRRVFAHQQARLLVNRFDLIAFEALGIQGLAMGRSAKSIHDAAWGMFTRFVSYKAENAGKHAIPVNPRGTSQECPRCGAVVRKKLSERTHRCECGVVLDRDHAAALVIEARALRVVGANACGGIGLCEQLPLFASRLSEAGSPNAGTLLPSPPCET